MIWTGLVLTLALAACRESLAPETPAIVPVSGSAAKPITKECFEGTEMVEESGDRGAGRVIATHEIDREARTVVHRRWLSLDPEDEHVMRFTVAAASREFEIESDGIRGIGSFEGAPWKWTSYRGQLDGDGVTVELRGVVADHAQSVDTRVTHKDRLLRSRHFEAKSFDCATLQERRLALDDTGRLAARYCFAGSEVDLNAKRARVVFEQIIEPARIRIRRYSLNGTDLVELAIDGSAITVTLASHPHFRATGQLTGKPGGWTGYRWSTVLENTVPLSAEGTLGGPRMEQTTVSKSLTGTVAANAFPCSERDRRVAETRAPP